MANSNGTSGSGNGTKSNGTNGNGNGTKSNGTNGSGNGSGNGTNGNGYRGKKRGAATLAQQICNLKKNLSDNQIAQAEIWAKVDPKVVALAFKLSDHSRHRIDGLSKKSNTIYEQLLGISKKAAEQWKLQLLIDKQTKVESKK